MPRVVAAPVVSQHINTTRTINNHQLSGESHPRSTNPTTTTTMLVLASCLSFLSMVTAQFPYWGLANTRILANNVHARNLLSGRFVMRSMPGDSVFLKRYLNFWSMPDVDAMAESVMETPLEVSISEDGTMLTMVYGEETMLTFGVGKDITDPTTGKYWKSLACLSCSFILYFNVNICA